jgi:hypothetical protein
MAQLNRTFGLGMLLLIMLSFSISACCCSNRPLGSPSTHTCCCCKAPSANQKVQISQTPVFQIPPLNIALSGCDCMKSNPGKCPLEIQEAVQSRISEVKSPCFPATGLLVLWNAAPAAEPRIPPGGFVFHFSSFPSCSFPLRI